MNRPESIDRNSFIIVGKGREVCRERGPVGTGSDGRVCLGGPVGGGGQSGGDSS